MANHLITLLTDFGLEDPYVGIMKGVIQTRLPGALCVDLTHQVPPQNVAVAAYHLESAYRYFPPRTVHCCVVDPGVGSGRSVLAVSFEDFLFLAPDNGVLSRVLSREGARKMVRVENTGFFLKRVSRTFHGRDIFAPVAAALASGVPLEELGPETGNMKRVEPPRPRKLRGEVIEGEVAARDRFGNLVTNIPGSLLPKDPEIRIMKRVIPGLSSSYAERGPGELLGVIGSTGYLEISINRGDAAASLRAGPGTPVRVAPRR
jgi:hypothetical protein